VNKSNIVNSSSRHDEHPWWMILHVETLKNPGYNTKMNSIRSWRVNRSRWIQVENCAGVARDRDWDFYGLSLRPQPV
jgi:hypothetical protein